MLTTLILVSLVFCAVMLALFLDNWRLFRRAMPWQSITERLDGGLVGPFAPAAEATADPHADPVRTPPATRAVRDGQGRPPGLSVLIPARNEAGSIGRTLDALLASEGVTLEVIVYDDGSEDGTSSIVTAAAIRDERVRLVVGDSLPAGWLGKMHACQRLSELARYQTWLFLDADVAMRPDGLARALAMRAAWHVDLLSGFPRQKTESVGEALLVPWIDLVLLSYLPFRLMRGTTWPAASAGCGQFLLTTAEAYHAVGGHESIRTRMHDGVAFPRLYRRQGRRTDLIDASDIATIRMFDGFSSTWQGFLKNAHEAFAAPGLIGPITLCVTGTTLLPLVTLVWAVVAEAPWIWVILAAVATALGWLPRILVAMRSGGDFYGGVGAALHPVSAVVFLALQWTAFLRRLVGLRPTWRGRAISTDRTPASM